MGALTHVLLGDAPLGGVRLAALLVARPDALRIARQIVPLDVLPIARPGARQIARLGVLRIAPMDAKMDVRQDAPRDARPTARRIVP